MCCRCSLNCMPKKTLFVSDKNLPLTANTSPITTVEGVARDFLLSFTFSRARIKCDVGKRKSFLFNSHIICYKRNKLDN